MTSRVAATYVLPLRADVPRTDLRGYLDWLATIVDVVVVDGSDDTVFAAHRHAWPATVTHLPVDPDLRSCAMGKVAGVLTGVRHAAHDSVVIADDDVFYEAANLREVVARLAHADVVVPQNYFEPLPWHAVWDSGRTLLNRAVGHDYPGTLAVRRSVLERSGGYEGDVMFENLQLMRTVEAVGGTVQRAPDLLVRREPPTAAHFRGQRVRQAYDSLAQPGRLVLELSLAPAGLFTARRWGAGGLAVLAAAGVALAEVGRRRDDAQRVFPLRTSLAAPLWLVERSVCIWIALGARARGGVRYGGRRLHRAASSRRALARRYKSLETTPAHIRQLTSVRYSSAVCWAIAGQLKCSSTRRRPAAP
jgi:hypothetical protein